MEAPGPAVAPSEPGNEAPPPAEASPPPGASGGAEDGRLRPGAKRVTFPSDEDIVSGAVEPKDPWRHAQNVTVEEIVTAYKLACQKLSCRQIPKLLKQIEELKDLAPRIECLDLKGEKLDYKACEALEEVFKRVQFKIVDLEQTNLDEDGASALFDMIEYYESATHLNISCNKHIGTRGWQAAAHMMRKTSCLQYLDARNTPLLDHSAPFVARALRISSSLAVLHLESTSLSGRPLMLLGFLIPRPFPIPGRSHHPKPSPFPPGQVKSFLETQKALLAEIQNGCKRNFVLAREREEQQLQHSASMPEVAHEDKDEGPTEATAEGTEPPEPTANGDGDNGDDDDDNGTDSDSDTDDEADAAVTKDSSEAAERTDVTAPGPPRDRPCPLSVTEQGGPASPQCAERRISVSSPGRGHKIFVVTRVEALPEPPNPETPANGAPVSRSDPPLPNGLKPDFARALPDADGDGKTGSCAAQHELSCAKNEQELEELLREAVQDAGQEPL
ncbi:protein phosphatase 1 regulatory subunit 37 [Patagioenas fasciata monilis]|uniref:Protein phosphatase 1 regulatory subunit 37 n=1 Tax=Patagioenas fasciata monilis TaxID=372326 RepID=A0A1V4KG08_PATFA|nr:protein phosphatase 1 regulatory subunit 37 [Patagioenas fasciata monilis]